MSDTSLNPKGPYLPSVELSPGATDSQWAPARSLRFVVLCSLGLWVVILGAAIALF